MIEAQAGRILTVPAYKFISADDVAYFADIGAMLDFYVTHDVTKTLEDNLITRARSANNLPELNVDSARRITRVALERFC